MAGGVEVTRVGGLGAAVHDTRSQRHWKREGAHANPPRGKSWPQEAATAAVHDGAMPASPELVAGARRHKNAWDLIEKKVGKEESSPTRRMEVATTWFDGVVRGRWQRLWCVLRRFSARFEREREWKRERNESGRGGSGSSASKREAEARGGERGKWGAVATLPLSVRGKRGRLLKEEDDMKAPCVIEQGGREGEHSSKPGRPKTREKGKGARGPGGVGPGRPERERREDCRFYFSNPFSNSFSI